GEPRARQRLEEGGDIGDLVTRLPAAAANDDDGRTRWGRARNERVELQLARPVVDDVFQQRRAFVWPERVAGNWCQRRQPGGELALVGPLARPPVFAAVTGALHLDELAAPVPLADITAISLRPIDWRLRVSAAVHDEDGQPDRAGRRQRAREQPAVDIFEPGCRAEIVEPTDEHRADDACGTLGGKERREMTPGVFAEQHEAIGIDAKLAGPAAKEREGSTDIGQRVFVPRQPSEPVVEREPVVARVSQELEDLSDMSGTAARRPSAAVNDHDGRTRTGALLNVGVEGQVACVGNLALDARDDVVAVGIADVERGARLRECRGRSECECENDRNERNRQPAEPPAAGERSYGCRTASPNAVRTSFAVKLQWPYRTAGIGKNRPRPDRSTFGR